MSAPVRIIPDIRLLHLDIETTPAVVYVWRLFDQNISVEQIIEPTSLLCFAAKWHGESGPIIFHRATKRSGPEFTAMVKAAHQLLSEAEAVCHYNGNTFDIPRLNQEFLRLNLKPPPPIPNIDLKLTVQRKFSATSSKLAFVGPYFEVGEKVQNEGWSLWRGCLKNDPAAWKKMETYNKGDVLLLERLYTKLRPWIEQHPNMGLYVKETIDKDGLPKPVCPTCGSTKLQRRGVTRAVTFAYHRFQCLSCGRWSRSRLSSKTEPHPERR